MKVEVSSQDLIHALTTIMRAVSLKSTLPVLANVCLSTTGNKLQLSSTNLELGINYWIEAKIEKEGSLSVPARLFLEYVSSLDIKTLTLSAQDEIVTVTSSTGEATFSGIAASEFPPVPSLPETSSIFLDPREFQKAVSQVAFAASSDTGRAVLSGILLQFTPERVMLVATDGYRLAQKSWERQTGIDESMIIPAKSLFEISRIVADCAIEGEELKIHINKEKNQVLFGLDSVHMTTRLLDGQYPNYEKIIPQSFVCRVLLEASRLSAAVRTAGVFAKDLGSVIKLEFKANNTIEFSSSTTQVGSSKNSIEASVEGQELTVAVNQKFIMEALSAIPTTQVSLELTSPTSPAVLRGVGDSSYLHLIMPVRMQQ